MADVALILGTAGGIVGIVGGGGGLVGLLHMWRQERRAQHQDFWATYEKQIALLERQHGSETDPDKKTQLKQRLDSVADEYHEQLEAYRQSSALRQSARRGILYADQPPLTESQVALLSELVKKAAPLSPALLTADDYFSRGNAAYDLQRYDEALAAYTRALELRPDDPDTLSNWGTALSGQAKMKEGEEADRLFALAAEKYQAALNIKPDLYEALNNWGNALFGQAKMKEGEEADRLFALAAEKYQAALNIKPDLHEALYNWANALSNQAKMNEGEEAHRLFALAAEKYHAALNIKPDFGEALYNRACLFSLTGRLKESLADLEEAISRDAATRKSAREDADFDNLRSDPTLGPEFERLVAEPGG